MLSRLFLLVLFWMGGLSMYGQGPQPSNIALARQYMQNKEYEKAIPLFQQLYESAPFDKAIYDEYLDVLLLANKYPEAEQLVTYMSKVRREDPLMFLDMGKVQDAAGKKKKAEEQYDLALNQISGEDFRTRQLADAFVRINQYKYAIKAYEKARVLMQNPYIFSTELALLYSKEGNSEQAVNAMMDVLVMQPHVLNDVKESLLQVTEGDDKKMAITQKLIAKRLTAQPDNPMWVELLTWIYTQKGDYQGAFLQITALDKKLKEEGERVVKFAKAAEKDAQYVTALKAYDYVLAKGAASPMNEEAREGKINVLLAQLEFIKPIDEAKVINLENEYASFLFDYPQHKSSAIVRDYAMVKARYAHKVDTAIAILEEAIHAPNVKRNIAANCKLDLGDYYLLQGKIWDASLVYSQVEKAYKEDVLGEEARFRNAKLSYYRGDFKWAQGQLSVLKASTTELIANDALYLSVLITENMPPDSNLTPLLRFVAADLLLFQNKTEASDRLLDSISKAFPENPLLDDVYLLRAKIAEEEGRNADAVTYLERILKDYGEDVLGDDAAFKLGQLFDEKIKDKAKALQYYEILITEYPGSTYIQTARARYQKLKAGKETSS